MARPEKIKSVPSEGTPASQEINRPMAVKEIMVEDRIDAMEAYIAVLERRIERHEQYHFGKKK